MQKSKWYLKENIIDKVIKWGLFAFLIILVLPLLGISFYNFPFSDDFANAKLAHETVLSGGNIFDVIGAAGRTAWKTYFSWQGSYSACFLMALNPIAWGVDKYFIGTFVLLITFVISELLFLDGLLSLISMKKDIIRIFSYSIIIIQLLFVPGIVESFYWYTGAIYYTFFYSLSLILFSLMIKRNEKKRNEKRTIFLEVSIFILAFFIAGGNYSTALITNIVLGTIFLLAIVKNKKIPWFYLSVTLVSVMGLVLSVLSPGNRNHQATMGMTPIESIFASFRYGGEFAFSWIHSYIVVLYMVLIPFIWKGLKQSKFQFRLPGVVIAFAMGVFSAMFTPVLYAIASTGPPRLMCIIYYLFLLLFGLCLVYILGWIQKRNLKIFSRFSDKKKVCFRYGWSILCLICFLGIMGLSGIKHTNPVLAALEIKNGNAEAFRQENLDRIELLENPELEIVILEDFVVKPHIIYLSELEEDFNYKNVQLADYYYKDSVKLRSYCEDDEE